MPTNNKKFENHIEPLNIGGIDGRMLHLSATSRYKNKEILFIYDRNASLEECGPMAVALNRYGSVTVVDLPGFGGMKSLSNVGIKPNIDNLAEYLATFIRWRYKRSKITIVGAGVGFVIATRMLQNYPELQNKLKLIVSIAGFSHNSDLNISKSRYRLYTFYGRFLGHWPLSAIFRIFALNGYRFKPKHNRDLDIKNRLEPISAKSQSANNEWLKLSKKNNIRTWLVTSKELLSLDNCKNRIDAPLAHVSIEGRSDFNEYRVEQHLKVIFSKVSVSKVKLSSLGVNPTNKSDAQLITPKVRSLLRET